MTKRSDSITNAKQKPISIKFKMTKRFSVFLHIFKKKREETNDKLYIHGKMMKIIVSKFN